MTMLIAVPTGVKFFNWIGTMWRGSITFETPDALGHRLPGDVPLRRPDRRHPGEPARWTSTCRTPTSWWRTSTTSSSAPSCSRCSPASTSGGPSSPARCSTSAWASCTSGCCSSASTPRSSSSTGWASRACPGGMPTTWPRTASDRMNEVSTVGSFILGVSMLPFLYNVYKTWRDAPQVESDDPWGYGALAGVGDLLPAAAAQLRLDPADPLRAPRVRPAPPGGRDDLGRARTRRAVQAHRSR